MGEIISETLHNYIGYIPPETDPRVPTPNDDSTKGYSRDSTWYQPEIQKIFKCINPAAGSAVWTLLCSNGLISNKSGAELTQLFVVRPNTPQGGFPTAVYAKADTHNNSLAFGVIVESIVDNGKGFIIKQGVLHSVNSSGSQFGEVWADGDELYLSAANDGYLTKTKPATPYHAVKVGRVITAHANTGVIFVDIELGKKITDMHDVSDTPADTTGQSLIFDATLDYWFPDLVIPQMNQTGIVSWAGTGDYYDESFPDGEFRLLRAPTGRIKGKEIIASAPQDTAALAANTTNFIYIDSSGNIQKTTTRTHALFIDNIVLFEVLYDGTNYEVVREDHPFDIPAAVSNDMHDIIGVRFEANAATMQRVTTGTGSLATDRQLKQVGNAEIHDHGIESELLDSSGAGVTFRHYYTNGAGKYNRDSLSAEFPMKYNNAGTPTTLTVNRFGVFPIYLSKDDKNTLTAKAFSLMHTAEFTTLTQAQTAIADGSIVGISNELSLMELTLYGYIIVKNTGDGGHIQEVDIQKSIIGGATLGGGVSNQASLIVNDATGYTGLLSTADTTSQAVADTLNALGASISETDAGTATNKVVTPAGLQGSKHNIRYIHLELVDKDTDVEGDDTVAIYSYRLQCSGTILQDDDNKELLNAYVITAGTTGTMVVDIHYDGTTIMTTDKIEIETGEESSTTATDQPNLTTTAVVKGKYLTFYIDTAQTTPAKGCYINMAIRES